MVTEKDKRKAQRCLSCPLCRYARKWFDFAHHPERLQGVEGRQKGLLFWLVKKIQGLCPFCKAYEKVYGLKAHEPIPHQVR